MARDLWWAFAAVAVASLWLAVAAVLAARRPLKPAELAAWASGHGLEGVADRRLEPATRYLRRSRLCRTVGGAVPFVAGTAAPALWAATRGLPAPWPLGLFGARSWLAGYLAGVLVAEYRWARPRTGVVALSWACTVGALAAWIRVGHPRRWTVRWVLARDAGGPGRA